LAGLLLLGLANTVHAKTELAPGLSHAEASLCQSAVVLAQARMGQIFPWLRARSMPRVRFFPAGAPEGSASPWVGGIYHANDHRIDIQHVPRLISQGRLEWTVQHEFVHAALALSGTARLPLWLEEGSAIYLSAQTLDETDRSITPARSIAQLESGFRTHSISRNQSAWIHLKMYNRQARAIIAALVERNGIEHFTGFLRTLKNGTPFSQALASWYGLAPSELSAWL